MKPLRDALILLVAILTLLSVRVGPAPGVSVAAPAVLAPASAAGVPPAPSRPVPALVAPRCGTTAPGSAAPTAPAPGARGLDVARTDAAPAARPAART